jgi:O-antigen ligase
LFLFLVAYPVAFIGETVLLRNAIYIYSIFCLIYFAQSQRDGFIKVKVWQKFVLLMISGAAFIIYLPILIETYFDLGLFTGPEEHFISNHRESHMLGFAAPMLIGSAISFVVIKSLSTKTDFENLYRVLKIFTWIVVVGSLIRYISQIEIIPQSYIQSVRLDGFRLSGFMNPDAIGYGRTLLIPFAFILSYVTSKQKYGKDAFLLFLIIISLFITFSRIIVATTIIMMVIVFLYNFRMRIMLKGSLFLFVVITFLIFNGAIDRLGSRSAFSSSSSGINLSGRDLIYTTGIPIVVASPYVGLRPGGYVSMLRKGYLYYRDGQVGEMNVVSAHSFYLVIALEWGMPFLLFLLGVMFHCLYLLHKTIFLTNKYIFLKGFRHIRIWSVASLSLLAGLLIQGITDFIPYPFVFFLIGLPWSLYLIVRKTIYLHLMSEASNFIKPNFHEDFIHKLK